MEIVTIEQNYLYAVKYKDEQQDEYNRIFDYHSDFERVLGFFETNMHKIEDYYVSQLGLERHETEAYAQYVVDETIELEEYFEDLIDNSISDASPNLRGHFKILEGFEGKDFPALKSYGLNRPSLLRVYAIEMLDESLLIFYSGIKITKKIKDCPGLKDNVLQKAHLVISFLKREGIIDAEDLERV